MPLPLVPLLLPLLPLPLLLLLATMLPLLLLLSRQGSTQRGHVQPGCCTVADAGLTGTNCTCSAV
jgi:hypothetical protein